jgi:hypothetical protein
VILAKTGGTAKAGTPTAAETWTVVGSTTKAGTSTAAGTSATAGGQQKNRSFNRMAKEFGRKVLRIPYRNRYEIPLDAAKLSRSNVNHFRVKSRPSAEIQKGTSINTHICLK